MDGLGFAPMGFWLSMLISMLVIKLLMGYLGFKLGTSVIETLSDKIGKISSAANIVGVTVIAALATSFVKANIAIKYSHNVESGEKQVIAIQDILDKITPKMLPVILTILVFYLIKKRKWNTYQLLIFFICDWDSSLCLRDFSIVSERSKGQGFRFRVNLVSLFISFLMGIIFFQLTEIKFESENTMNLQKIENYQLKFYQQDWLSGYLEKHSKLLEPLFERTYFLLKDQIIYNDAMDMEACSIPYSLKEYTWNRYPGDDPEWLFMLSRQSFLLDLSQAYALTKEKCYLQKWRSLLLDFIQEEGEPNSTNRNVWRPLDVGIRVMNWLKSLTYISIADYKQLGIDKVLRNALLVHLEYLERSYIDKYRLSNWGVLVTGGMAAMDLFLPELVNRVN